MSFAALLISLTSNQGLAHHGCNTPGALWGQNVSLLRLDTENKVFGTHNALTLVPSLSYAPFKSFSAGIRLPFSQMTINNQGTTQSGLGDLELSLQGTVFSIGQKFTMLLGTELEVPTGDTAAGVSGGHYAVIPHTTLAWRPSDRWILSSMFLYTYGLEDTEEHSHGHGHDHDHGHGESPVYQLSPHSSQELTGLVGASYLGDNGYVTLMGEAIYGVTGPQTMGPISLLSETGVNLTEDLTVNVRVKMPLAGTIRESWSVTSGIIWRWDTPADATIKAAKSADECDCPSEPHANPHHEADRQQPPSEPACESCDKP